MTKAQTQFQDSSIKNGTSISILMHGFETCILKKDLIEKLDIYARTCFHIMLGIKQSRDHVTNKSLYQLTGHVSLRKKIFERHFKFAGHCICISIDDPAKRFINYDQIISSTRCSKKDISESSFVVLSILLL